MNDCVKEQEIFDGSDSDNNDKDNNDKDNNDKDLEDEDQRTPESVSGIQNSVCKYVNIEQYFRICVWRKRRKR